MSRVLPRFYRRQEERRRRDDYLGPILLGSEAVDEAVRQAVVETETAPKATLPGDTRRLRGIPVCTFGVQGTAPGTDPLQAAIRALSGRTR